MGDGRRRLAEAALRLGPVHRAYRRLVPLDVGQPEWRELFGDDLDALHRTIEGLPDDAPRVLLASSPAGPAATIVDGILAIGLTLHGARVSVVLCDELLPACSACNITAFRSGADLARRGPQARHCEACFEPARAMFAELGIPTLRFGDGVTDADRAAAASAARDLPLDELGGLVADGVRIGEHATAAAIRFFAGDHRREPDGELVLRRYAEAALLTAGGVRAAVHAVGPEVVSFHHGIYVPQGVVGDVVRAEGARVVNWAKSYRTNTFLFSHGDTYHHTLLDEPTAGWESMTWGPAQETEIVDYLDSRRTGARDWIRFNSDAVEDIDAIRAELGVDPAVPTVALLTNVAWDAQLFYAANAYPTMTDWIVDTVEQIGGRADLQLVIRIHPGEVTAELPARQRMEDELRAAFPELPRNVFVIPPESKLSTYALALSSDAALVYGTKTGAELAALGLPVVVAGEAWVRNKGITIDVASPEEYRDVLAGLPLGNRMPAEQVERAQRFAFHFFFRRMIPLPGIETTVGGRSPYHVTARSLAAFAPGADVGLDTICNGILDGAPFVYPAEDLVGSPLGSDRP